MICFILFLKLHFVKYGKTALHLAAYSGFEEILKILIESGSDIDLQDKVFFSFLSLFSIFSLLLVFLSYFFLFLLIVMGCV